MGKMFMRGSRGIRSIKEELRVLHRFLVMTKAGAYMFNKSSGKGVSWYGKCQRCNIDNWLQISHIEPKGRVRALEFDVDNAFAFCYHCHIHWWHKHPREAQEFRERMLGKQASDDLAVRARTTSAKDIDWYAMLTDFKKQVEIIQHGG